MSGDAIGVVVAVASGLLVGAERERRKGSGVRRGVAGIRTFAIIALLGALASILGGVALLAVALAFVGGAALVAYLTSTGEDPGLTTESAMVATLLIGALAVERPELAAALAVTMTILLATRSSLHRFVRTIVTEDELHDILIFAAAAVVVLPLVPNENMGPYDAINPFSVWRLVVLVMAIGGIGHVTTRVFGDRYGLPIAGLSGGFVSSVATITAMGRRAHEGTNSLRATVAAAVLSSVATIIQFVVVLASANPDVLRRLAVPLALAGVAAVTYGALAAWQIPRHVGTTPAKTGRAFRTKDAALFAVLVTVIVVVSAAANDLLGDSGVYVSAAVAGFADTHAAAASSATLASHGDVSVHAAALAVLIAATANSVTKIVAAFVAGGRRFGLSVGAGVVLILAGLWVAAPLI